MITLMIIKFDQDQDDLRLVRRHFLDQPLEFPFGQPDQLFDQPSNSQPDKLFDQPPSSSQSDVREGPDYLEGDLDHLFSSSSLEAPLNEPEYFDPLNYYYEGSALDYDFGNLQEEDIEHQRSQNKEQGQMLGEFLEMLNETTPEGREELYELPFSTSKGREELYGLPYSTILGREELNSLPYSATKGREKLYGLAQLRQPSFLLLESREKEPEDEVEFFTTILLTLHVVAR